MPRHDMRRRLNRLHATQRQMATDPAMRQLTLDEIQRLDAGTLTEHDQADAWLVELADLWRRVPDDLAAWRRQRFPKEAN